MKNKESKKAVITGIAKETGDLIILDGPFNAAKTKSGNFLSLGWEDMRKVTDQLEQDMTFSFKPYGGIKLVRDMERFISFNLDKYDDISDRNFKSNVINTGDQSSARVLGNRATAINSGDRSLSKSVVEDGRTISINSGNESMSESDGDGSISSVTGDMSISVCLGSNSISSSTGETSVAITENSRSVPAFPILSKVKKGYFHLIVEEPEQGLLPSAQRNLLKYLISNLSVKNSLTVATGSPYIVYTLNNCMLAGSIENQNVTEGINASNVGIWLLKDGGIKSLQDTETGLLTGDIFNDEFQRIHSEMFQLLKLK